MKIAVIGLGSIGKRHTYNALSLGHHVTVYDPIFSPGEIVPMPSADAIRRFGTTPNVGTAMRDADGVVIASPTDCHLAHLRLAIQLGKPVLCEKPIGDIGHAMMIRAELAKAKAPVMMGNNLRFNACVQVAKGSVENGELGRPLWANFTVAQQNTKYRDPVVLNWLAHELDLARYLLGPARVLACIGDRQVVDMIVGHESGCRSTVHGDYVSAKWYRDFHIHGEKEAISVDLERKMIFATAGNKCYQMEETWDENYVTEMEAFISLIGGEPWPNAATGVDGLATLELIEAAWLR